MAYGDLVIYGDLVTYGDLVMYGDLVIYGDIWSQQGDVGESELHPVLRQQQSGRKEGRRQGKIIFE